MRGETGLAELEDHSLPQNQTNFPQQNFANQTIIFSPATHSSRQFDFAPVNPNLSSSSLNNVVEPIVIDSYRTDHINWVPFSDQTRPPMPVISGSQFSQQPVVFPRYCNQVLIYNNLHYL